MAKSRDSESTHGKTGVNTPATGIKTESRAKGITDGLTGGIIKEAGLTTQCTASASTDELMGADTKASTPATKKTGMASTPGPTANSTKECGRTADSMAQGSLYPGRVMKCPLHGKMAGVCGLVINI